MRIISFMLLAGVALALCACSDASSEKAANHKAQKPLSAAASQDSALKGPGKITVVGGQASERPNDAERFRTYDIRGESMIQYAPAGAEITPEVRRVQVNVAVRNSPYASVHARLMSQRLSKEFIVFCSACHDDYANGVIGPSLLDKNEKEVLEMMEKYQSEPDANVLMTSLMERMTQEEKAFIARDIARFNAMVHGAPSPTSEQSGDVWKSNYVKEKP